MFGQSIRTLGFIICHVIFKSFAGEMTSDYLVNWISIWDTFVYAPMNWI